MKLTSCYDELFQRPAGHIFTKVRVSMAEQKRPVLTLKRKTEGETPV
ncbi:conjugal transfer protein, partial [Vibrio parahaemolyticus]